MNYRQKIESILKKTFNELSKKELWIWGAGNTAELYHEGFNRILSDNIHISGYIDKRAKQLGYCFLGKQVIEPDKLTNKNNICVLICTIRTETIEEIRNYCNTMNIKNYLVDELILNLHKNEVLKCYDSFGDERSREVYYELISSRISGKKLKEGITEKNQYFGLEQFGKLDENEVFVDCGAYDGDSIHEYLKLKNNIFKKVIAFEPDLQNFEKLNKNIKSDCIRMNISEQKFELYPYAIGKETCIARFERYEDNKGIGSKVIMDGGLEKGKNEVKIVALDDFIKEPYSFLKADIESYEYNMLLGAKESIKRNKPLLAICIYHNPVDFYSIPLLIKEILPQYKIAIRHYREDTSETVVYAWI